MVAPNTTESLVRRAKDGDRAAFEALTESCGDRLQSTVRSRIGPMIKGRIQVEDILQETYLRAFQSIDRFQLRTDDSFYHWLCGIAEHLIWNVAQKRGGTELHLVHDVVSDDASPSKGLRREERLTRLKAALDHLSPDQKEAIELAKIDGLKVSEIAARMKRSSDSVKQLLSRGLRQLRSSFGETESLHLPKNAFESRGERRDD